eukprot:COSAG02_NODE_5391_length_4372_cov_4.367657_7_plen_67_part_00
MGELAPNYVYTTPCPQPGYCLSILIARGPRAMHADRALPLVVPRPRSRVAQKFGALPAGVFCDDRR